MRRLVRLRQRTDAAVRRAGRRLGYDLIRANYYSPVPDLATVPPETWERAAPMPGVDLRLDASIAWLRDELESYLKEYAPPVSPPGTAHGYYTAHGGMYGRVDAEMLYAMIRRLRPPRIVEIGAGWSTRVIRDALARNAEEAGETTEHRLFDPNPQEVARRIGNLSGLTAATAQEIPAEVFASLSSGDILFVDSTHTVKPGGDVVRLVLEVLPSLAPGVVVHFHDFFRPFEYPRFLAELGVFWQEQYLLQAFLAGNSDFEVLAANHALVRLRHEALRELIPGIPHGASPGSALWLRRRL